MTLSVLTTVQQWVLFSGTALAVGCVAWRLFVSPGAAAELGTDGAALQAVQRRAASIGVLTSLALILAWVLRMVVQVMGFRDPFVPLSEDVSFLLFEMFWGTVWMAQGVTLLLLVGSFVWARSRKGEATAAWSAAGVLTLALVATLALSSHAMGADSGRALLVAADGVHALAAGTWIGSLTVILLAGRPAAVGPSGAAVFVAQLRAFSPMAVVSVAALLFMGSVLAWTHLAGLANLWETSYGRILAAKIAVAGAVLLAGLWNWRRGLPSSDTPEGAVTVQHRAVVEVSLALGVLLLTAVLVHSAKP